MADNFSELCSLAARKFVHTAIVVDNEAFFGGEGPSKPRVAHKASKPKVSATFEKEESKEHYPLTGGENALDTHLLNMKALGDAFLDKDIVCAIYKPTEGEEVVERTIKTASGSDIVIIDWQLEGERRGSNTAKKIILELMRKDIAEGPRLRLIAVYTGQKDLENLTDELKRYIDENGIREVEKDQNDSAVLVGPHFRLVFINKIHTRGVVEGDRVCSEEKLPEALLAEYAKLATGLLPSAAMAAIADIRHATSHVLAVFHKGLDKAFVSHRAMIPISIDAEVFLRKLITEELETIIETKGTLADFAGAEAVKLWLDHVKPDATGFKISDNVTLSSDDISEIIELQGEDASQHEKSFKEFLREKGVGTPKKIYSDFSKIFPGESTVFLTEFSRICSLKREANKRTRFHPSWCPKLTLGTIIKPLPDESGNYPFGLSDKELLCCVQPRCDSVRVPVSGRRFPFLVLTQSDDKFNIVLQNEGEDLTYKVGAFLYNTLLFNFVPCSSGVGVVNGVKDSSNSNKYVFKDSDGNEFLWVADMKDLHAQNKAGELGARAASVGYDEHEWLRNKSS